MCFGPVWGAVANVGLFNTPPGFEVDDANWDGAFTQNLDSASASAARPCAE